MSKPASDVEIAATNLVIRACELGAIADRGWEFSCNFCKKITRMPPLRIDHEGHVVNVPSFCAEESCGDAVYEVIKAALEEVN